MRKPLPRVVAIIAVMTLFVVTAQAAGQAQAISFKAEPGDTYTNLFGEDWYKAFEQNKATVFRQGQPITSPDILLAGMIITVTPDVRLTPRAQARRGELRHRREALSAMLSALENEGRDDADLQAAISRCRSMLADELKFAANADYVARQVEQIQQAVRSKAAAALPASATVEQGSIKSLLYATATCLIVAVLLLMIVLRKPKPQYPSGEARYQEAFTNLKKVMDEVSG